MKKFLYMVQTRAANADRHLPLKTKNSDLLVYSFEKNLDIAGSIYKPNTLWGEGRNILIHAAREMKQKYQYYVLLDDDVEFIKGGFKEFEKEVLNIKPDFCLPYYWPPYTYQSVYRQAKFILFRYSALRIYDDCMVCFSQRLFFDDDILPYHVSFYNTPFHHNSYYPPFVIWDRILARKQSLWNWLGNWLWAWLWSRTGDLRHNRNNKKPKLKVLCTTRVIHTNLNISHHQYNQRFRVDHLFNRIHGKNWRRLSPFHRNLPYEKFYTNVRQMRYRRDQYEKFLLKIKQRDISLKHSSKIKTIRYLCAYVLFRIYKVPLYFKEKLMVTFWIVFCITTYRDIKLNLLLLVNKQQNQS